MDITYRRSSLLVFFAGVANLYLVGQGTQPGGGTPSVMMSAKMTAREIAKDFAVPASVVNGVPAAQLGVAA